MSSSFRLSNALPAIGISQIALHQPRWQLPNAWYQSIIAKKFVKHTGIEARTISDLSEAELAAASIEALQVKSGCDLNLCAGIAFVSPSLVPMAVANSYLPRDMARSEQANRVATELCLSLGIQPRVMVGMNGFCSGYAKAMDYIKHRMLPGLRLSQREFIILVTATKISRINDFGCKQSGALFGDFSTATLITRMDSYQHAPRYEIIDASYSKKDASRPFFDFHKKEAVPVPEIDGGIHYEDRLVFKLDGMGIADTAPRAMAAAASELVAENSYSPDEIDHVVPHQAGTGIVRLTGMKLEEAGFVAQPINGLTKQTGNISSSSVPYALHENWNNLNGLIACPVAAVGAPGKPEVSQGCILLRRAGTRQSQAA